MQTSWNDFTVDMHQIKKKDDGQFYLTEFNLKFEFNLLNLFCWFLSGSNPLIENCPCLEIEFDHFTLPLSYPLESHFEQLAQIAAHDERQNRPVGFFIFHQNTRWLICLIYLNKKNFTSYLISCTQWHFFIKFS